MSPALRSHNRHTYQLTVSRDEVTIMAHLRSVGLVLPVLLIALRYLWSPHIQGRRRDSRSGSRISSGLKASVRCAVRFLIVGRCVG